MRILITGLSGTLAPVLAEHAKTAGHEVVGWPRGVADPLNWHASAAYLEQLAPDAIAHLAMGPVEWAAHLARFACPRALPLVFTSTAMVFDCEPDGPHGVHDACNARDDYGRLKMDCEDAIRTEHPAACVARLGWQIDATRPGNNMLFALDGWQRDRFDVAVSRRWRPACSFMSDTASTLLMLVESQKGGTVHLDSNALEGWRFDQIAMALAVQYQRFHWRLRVTDDYVHDQRLVSEEGTVTLPALSRKLNALTPMRLEP